MTFSSRLRYLISLGMNTRQMNHQLIISHLKDTGKLSFENEIAQALWDSNPVFFDCSYEALPVELPRPTLSTIQVFLHKEAVLQF